MTKLACADRVAATALVAGIIMGITTSALAGTQTLCVNPGGTGGCFASLSDAIQQITKKIVTITVFAGTYPDNVSINTGIKPKKLTLTITGSSGAAATIIQSNGSGSVITIGAKATVTLDGLTIEGGTGQVITPGTATGGGGIFASSATLTITNCTIVNNQANFGAGIYSTDGNLTVATSTISGNTASSNASVGGGIDFSGGKKRKLTISDSTIDSNSASNGGGIALTPSSGSGLKLSGNISGSTISNNVCIDNCDTGSRNSQGAGILVQQAKLTLTNSTLSGNQAAGLTGSGGGLLSSFASTKLNNVTIANNSAVSLGGGVFVDINNQKFVFSNTIIADNTATASPDCIGTLPSHDYNLIDDPTGCSVTDKTTHNLGGDPLLGPLQNNGGATNTQALLPGSPALAAGSPKAPNGMGSHCEPTDQAGTTRVKGDCDIGAYQMPD